MDESNVDEQLGVIGLDGRRGERLRQIGAELGFDVCSVLDLEQVRYVDRLDIDALLDDARERLRDRPVAGVTTYWDFPSSCIAAILAEEYDLPGPELRSVVIFEHKYWSRLLQAKVAPDDTPPFAAVDVFAEPLVDGPPLPYPFWLKPVKSFSGHLGFRIGSEADLRHALASLRAGIERLGGPFQQVLDRISDVPESVARLGGSGAIAEGLIDGDQCTLEGHVHDGEVDVHGVFDIHREADGSTFSHYTYPSRLPDHARRRMRTIATDLISAAGYDDGAFNIEFFVDAAEGRTWILEVNPRISQEHHHLMAWVDGATNLQVMARTALGEEPELRPGHGSCAMAAKYFVRRRDDATVSRVPDAQQVARIEAEYAPCAIEVLVAPGDRLSELPDQEPYSYLVAYVHLGADDEQELTARYEAVVDALDLGFDD
jgi:hypothetical protein